MLRWIDVSKIRHLYPCDQFVINIPYIEKHRLDEATVAKIEPTSLQIADFLRNLIQDMVYFSRQDRKFGPWNSPTLKANITPALMTLFEWGTGGIYEYAMLNYLTKIEFQFNKFYSSSMLSGEIVNTCLQISLDQGSLFKTYNKNFTKINTKVFLHLQRLLINFFGMWDPRKFISGQNLRTTRNYTPCLITLIKTFWLILKSDHRNSYHLLNDIYDSVWHALVEFFFLKKRNTFISNYF